MNFGCQLVSQKCSNYRFEWERERKPHIVEQEEKSSKRLKGVKTITMVEEDHLEVTTRTYLKSRRKNFFERKARMIISILFIIVFMFFLLAYIQKIFNFFSFARTHSLLHERAINLSAIKPTVKEAKGDCESSLSLLFFCWNHNNANWRFIAFKANHKFTFYPSLHCSRNMIANLTNVFKEKFGSFKRGA